MHFCGRVKGRGLASQEPLRWQPQAETKQQSGKKKFSMFMLNSLIFGFGLFFFYLFKIN